MSKLAGVIAAIVLVGCGSKVGPGDATCKPGRITYDGAPIELSHVLMGQSGTPAGSGSPGLVHEVWLANHAKITCEMMRVIRRRFVIEDGDVALGLHIFPDGGTVFSAGIELGAATSTRPPSLVRVRIEKAPVSPGELGTICVPAQATWEAEMFDGKRHTFTIEGSFSGTFCGARTD